jgi:hypothetical protein
MEKLVNDMEKRIKGKKSGKSKSKFARPNKEDKITDVVTLNSFNW